MVCEPCSIVGKWNPHVPVASAVSVPRTVVPSISVTAVPGAAVPVSVASLVMLSLALAPVSLASPMVGGTFGKDAVLNRIDVVTTGGGPKYIVRDHERNPGEPETGFVAADDDFAQAIITLARNPARLGRMRTSARAYALNCSWDAVFTRVYRGYQDALPADAFAVPAS